MAQRPQTLRRQVEVETHCVSNFYPLKARRGRSFFFAVARCHYLEEPSERRLAPRDETELKHTIFDALMSDSRLGSLKALLRLECVEFGGDCIGGLSRSDASEPPASSAVDAEDLEINAPDVYEARVGDSEWRPCVVRSVDGGVAQVQTYDRLTFWSDAMGREAAVGVEVDRVRPRRWEVQCNETVHVPRGHVLRIGPHGQLVVRERGADRDQRSGRLLLGATSRLDIDARADVDFRGTLALVVDVEVPGARPGSRPPQYRVEIEQTNVYHAGTALNSDMLQSIAPEERTIFVQCMSWILKRCYRSMELKTLGGRGWYRTDDPDRLPRPRSYFERNQVPPRVYLYHGWAPSLVQVAAGPHLKVDLSTRMVQHQSVLDKINLLRDRLRRDLQRRSPGRQPTSEEEQSYIDEHLANRTCVTTYNHMSYKIARVCLDRFVEEEFGSIGSVVDYFQSRWNLRLKPGQPLLHCPTRKNAGCFLPAEVAYLTGLDDDWRRDLGFINSVFDACKKDPRSHWQDQDRLVRRLAEEDAAGSRPLRDWGLSIDPEPAKPRCHMATHEPVYFRFEADEAFRHGQEPAERLAVTTSSNGFQFPPGSDIWTSRGQQVSLVRWMIFCCSSDSHIVAGFRSQLVALTNEVRRANVERVDVREPEVVEINGHVSEWCRQFRALDCDFALVVIPDWMRRDEPNAYFEFKSLITISQAAGTRTPSQMVLAASLKPRRSQLQVFRNILQQVLVKCGGWLWVFNPLPYGGRVVMVAGLEARKGDSAFVVACSSVNRYFTQYHTSWRRRDSVQRRGVDYTAPCGEVLVEAFEAFYRVNKILPTELILYRAGVSDSQIGELKRVEVGDLVNEDRLKSQVAESQTLREAMGEEVEEKLSAWADRFSLAFILVRRNTQARFTTSQFDNVPSGTFITEEVVAQTTTEEEMGSRVEAGFEFFLVAQKSIGVARPSLCTVLHSDVQLTRRQVVELTFRLCGLYMTFPGRVALPAPLRYANKLLNLILRCDGVAAQSSESRLFFI